MKQNIEINVPPHLTPLLKAAGISLEQAIESYLFDLGQCCHGSNGSDERMMAREYFQRCWYGCDDEGKVERVFEALTTLRYEWYNYGRSREEEFEQLERDTIQQLAEEGI